MEKEAAKRIAIIGPESTGKSELSKNLAEHFGTVWVPEYARTYLDQLDRAYEKTDLLNIAKGQVVREDEKVKLATNFIFCDTNLIVIKIWSDHKYGSTDSWILDELSRRSYDFYLLTDIDLPWHPDPQREHPHLRIELFNRYEKYLKVNHLPYATISGIHTKRLQSAITALQLNFKV